MNSAVSRDGHNLGINIFLSLFNRVLISGIIASTILFSNGSKFDNLSEPVIIRLSADNKVTTTSSSSIKDRYLKDG